MESDEDKAKKDCENEESDRVHETIVEIATSLARAAAQQDFKRITEKYNSNQPDQKNDLCDD